MYGYAWWRSAPLKIRREPLMVKPPDLLNPMVRMPMMVLMVSARRVLSNTCDLTTYKFGWSGCQSCGFGTERLCVKALVTPAATLWVVDIVATCWPDAETIELVNTHDLLLL